MILGGLLVQKDLYSNDEKLDLVLDIKINKNVYEVLTDTCYVYSLNNEVSPVAFFTKRTIMYQEDKKNDQIKVITFSWIFMESLDLKQNNEVQLNIESENIRYIANSSVIGKLFKNASIKIIYVNKNNSWGLISLEGWVDENDVRKITNNTNNYFATTKGAGDSRKNYILNQWPMIFWYPLMPFMLFYSLFGKLKFDFFNIIHPRKGNYWKLVWYSLFFILFICISISSLYQFFEYFLLIPTLSIISIVITFLIYILFVKTNLIKKHFQ
jgi:hypothetical protein